MFYDFALWAAIIIFCIGLIHKIDTWFILNVGTGDRTTSMTSRFAAGAKGILKTIFSIKIFAVIKVLVVDVLFQVRILKDSKDPWAWIMHLFIFVGFILLLLFHALDSYVTAAINPDFQATLNPNLFLRNFFGFLVLIGLVLAVVRRAVLMRGQIKTTGMDVYAIVILAVIIGSGFLLEGLKITSYSEYQIMVEDYGDSSDEAEAKALEAYWVEDFGLVSPNIREAASAETLALGKEAHEASCMECHSRPRSAFVSYPLSRLLKPFAISFDQAGGTTILWYIHFLACFFGLAYLVFSKFFHIISTPVSLIVAEVSRARQAPATAATRQMIELDGCSHGGICHTECPVRKRRIDRIEQEGAFAPMLGYIEGKTAAELGSRDVAK